MNIKEINVHIDGASRGNPGPAGIGILITDTEGNIIKEHKKFLGFDHTNNEAEYLALRNALKLAIKSCKGIVHVFSDSQLLIRQLIGIYQVRKEHLRKLFVEIKAMEIAFEKVIYTHIRREQNEHADRLANEAIDEAI
ncbi:MAG: ribonuclease HI family protein [Candidatus Helarchaeota archaeon]|nr:ribonuclease HI family protein [Candidatus Helarchaeota archaeon]